MIAVLSQAAEGLAEFLGTYLIHSTLWIVAILLIRRFWRSASGEVRVLLCRSAYVVPVVTSMAVSMVDVPHVGLQLSLPEISEPAWSENSLLVSNRKADTALTSLLTATDEAFSGSEKLPEASTTLATRGASLDLAHGVSRNASLAAPAGDDRQSASRPLPLSLVLTLACATAGMLACIRIGLLARRLGALRKRSTLFGAGVEAALVNALLKQAAVRRRVDVAQSAEIHGPLAAGVIRSFILVPCGMIERLSQDEFRAMLAHELAHVIRRDALWKLVGQAVCHVFFFQPLNFAVRHRLELDAEFVADEQAALLLGERSSLASCLTRMGEWIAVRPAVDVAPHPLATGMASFRSTLGQRVETLLHEGSSVRTRPVLTRVTFICLLTAMTTATATLAPRAVAESPAETPPSEKVQPMKRQLTTLALLAGLTVPAGAEEGKPKEQPQRPPITKKTADDLPKAALRFNGMIVGRLVKKDVEKGTFVINVDAVPRVWRNSKAESPKSLIGKNITVDGVFGKWLDVLLLVKNGETLECEARHDGGNGLTFPGELLRKVAPFKPGDYPVLPEEFRGFAGAVAGKVVVKNTDLMEIIIQVDRVLETWKKNAAKKPESIVGKRVMLGGFWQRKDAYHGLKAGDRIEVGLQHIGRQSDHLSVTEFVRKASRSPVSPRPGAKSDTSLGGTRLRDGFPAEMRGFNGMLAGKLVSKDVEKGTFVINVDAVPRVWRNSKARNPKSIVGRNVEVDGVSGKWLDVLLLVKKGETLECESRHDGGDRLTFPGELLRKIAPVKPGDYPELPEEFRGFQGTLVGKIAKKDGETMELTMLAGRIKETSEKNRARKAESIVGKPVMVIGFWRSKDAFHALKEGDTIECVLQHIQPRSDHLTVGRFRKVSAERD